MFILLVGSVATQAQTSKAEKIKNIREYMLADAKVEGIAPFHWHNLRLRFEGDMITGYVDGKQVLQAKSDRYPKGMAGLMAPMQQHRISTPYFDNLNISFLKSFGE